MPWAVRWVGKDNVWSEVVIRRVGSQGSSCKTQTRKKRLLYRSRLNHAFTLTYFTMRLSHYLGSKCCWRVQTKMRTLLGKAQTWLLLKFLSGHGLWEDRKQQMHPRVLAWRQHVLHSYGQVRSSQDEELYAFSRVKTFANINTFSGIFKEIHRKVPSIAVMPRNSLEIRRCNFKGDTSNDAFTSGILLLKSDANIYQCQFAHHKGGSIICDLNP